ncbi:MAG TPA: CRTAC1 family protein [Candidatus Acidoferrum sp.]|nr:CRTAC1 family protein [Candidatus Acidoferrum sp.]
MNRRSATIIAAALVVALMAVGVIGIGMFGIGRGSASALGTPHFVDEAASSGVVHTYDGNSDYYVGGGLAVFDCNGDSKPDLYIAGGSNPAALYRNDSPVGGALRFTALHDPATDLTGVNGAYPIDINGDGIVDLVVLRFGGNVILRGLGNCRFERANELWAFDGGSAWSTAFSAKWEGNATLPTLAIGNYLKLDAAGKQTSDCADNELLRPNAAGTAYAAPLALTPGYCSLSLLFSDWDLSGRRDLRVSNDRHYYRNGEEQLWRVAPGEAPRLYTAADGWAPVQIEGMGIASYDVTGDGYPDVYLTSQADNKLQTLTAGPSRPAYHDIALSRGVTATSPFIGGDILPSTAWHPEFQDVNNDGFIDLFVSKGNVSSQPDFAQKDPSDLFLGQPDGTFVEHAQDAGILSYARGRGAALVDLNGDGLLDLVEVNLGAPVGLWRNVGAGSAAAPKPLGHWLGIDLLQTGPNRDGIGSWIDVRAGDFTMRREVTIGGGHISGQLGPSHFGLGQSTTAQVRVTWPDGTIGPWMPVSADSSYVIQRGAAGATAPASP